MTRSTRRRAGLVCGFGLLNLALALAPRPAVADWPPPPGPRGSCSSCMASDSTWYNCCPSCNPIINPEECNCTLDDDC